MLFRTIHDIALMIDREHAGRKLGPSAGALDSQTIWSGATNSAAMPLGSHDPCRRGKRLAAQKRYA